MKMSKTCQRLNDKLLTVLNTVTEEAQLIDGFSFLNHTVQFDCFPGSLLVLCHFDSSEKLLVAQASNIECLLQNKLHKLLLKKGIVLKKPKTNLKLQGPDF